MSPGWRAGLKLWSHHAPGHGRRRLQPPWAARGKCCRRQQIGGAINYTSQRCPTQTAARGRHSSPRCEGEATWYIASNTLVAGPTRCSSKRVEEGAKNARAVERNTKRLGHGGPKRQAHDGGEAAPKTGSETRLTEFKHAGSGRARRSRLMVNGLAL